MIMLRLHLKECSLFLFEYIVQINILITSHVYGLHNPFMINNSYN